MGVQSNHWKLFAEVEVVLIVEDVVVVVGVEVLVVVTCESAKIKVA